jgi:hypothetical protein
MSYLTIDEAKQYLGDRYLSAYININTDLVDDTILQSDLDRITADINNRIGRVYSQVITSSEGVNTLKDISYQLIDYACYRRYDASEVPDAVIEGLKDARIRLREIQDGSYPLNTETQSPRNSSFVYSYNSPDSTGKGRTVFDRDSMAGI